MRINKNCLCIICEIFSFLFKVVKNIVHIALEPVWIGCLQSLNAKCDFINRLALLTPQKSACLHFQNLDFLRLQKIAKLCFFRNADWVTAIFFFGKSK